MSNNSTKSISKGHVARNSNNSNDSKVKTMIKIRKNSVSPATSTPATKPEPTKAKAPVKATKKAATKKAKSPGSRVPTNKAGQTPVQFMVGTLFPQNIAKKQDDEQLLATLSKEFPSWQRLEVPGCVSLFRREYNNGKLSGQDGKSPAKQVPQFRDGEALAAWGERGTTTKPEPKAKVTKKTATKKAAKATETKKAATKVKAASADKVA